MSRRRPLRFVAATRISLAVAIAVVCITLAPGADASASGEPVRCGDTITADTTLANDLIDCPGKGIVVGADHVTLDLNGHTIDGDGAGEGCADVSCDIGVDVTGHHEGVTIRGGSVTDFEEGVWIEGGRHHSLRRLSVTRNGHGILLAEARDSRVDSSSADANLFAGIFVVVSHNIRIHGSSASGNDGAGIPIRDSDHVRIDGNSVSGNSGPAVVLFEHSIRNAIERNSLSDNDDGIVVEGSDQNVVKHNSASGNGGGVVIVDSNGNLVQKNSLHDNVFVGIVVIGSDDNRIEGNSIIGNSQDEQTEGGIHLASNDQGDTSDRNVVSRNELSGNAPDGLLVETGQAGTRIELNRANENADDGIDIDSSLTSLTRNTANHNHDLGIEAVPGVADGGGNKASGNGNPLQCVNVFCQ